MEQTTDLYQLYPSLACTAKNLEQTHVPIQSFNPLCRSKSTNNNNNNIAGELFDVLPSYEIVTARPFSGAREREGRAGQGDGLRHTCGRVRKAASSGGHGVEQRTVRQHIRLKFRVVISVRQVGGALVRWFVWFRRGQSLFFRASVTRPREWTSTHNGWPQGGAMSPPWKTAHVHACNLHNRVVFPSVSHDPGR